MAELPVVPWGVAPDGDLDVLAAALHAEHPPAVFDPESDEPGCPADG